MEENVKNVKLKIKVSKIIMLILVIVIIVAGVFAYKEFTKPKDDNSEQQETNNNSTPTPVEEKKVKIIDVDSKTRPYAIMINSHNGALPQSGLQDAYIVYELMVESGITRMMALFKDVDFTKVGSIRSVRTQYLAYAYENDAIIVHAGGATDAIERMSKEKISNFSVDGKYGQRDKELAKKRAWEHTLFTKTDSLNKAVSDLGIRNTTETKPLLSYSVDELDLSKYQTTPANKVTIKYSSYRTSSYDYDSDSKTFLRNIGNQKNTDLVTGKQYQVKNVIAYSVKHTTYNGAYQRLSNIGTGEGYYFTNGVALPITWEKTDEKSQTVYKIKETGEELMVNDGNTYIQIYPSNGGKLTIS